MELGLTLGGGATASGGGVDVPSGKSTNLALALGVNSHQEAKTRSADGDRTVRIDPSTRLQLDVLPLWASTNANTGSSDGVSSAAKGFDVNTTLAVVPAEEVSSPNSVASAFVQGMDLCIFGGGGGEKTTSSRGASDDEENVGGPARKKLRLSKEQSAFLEESFKEHNTLNPKQKQALAKQLNLRPRQVEVWFQNRRARTKLKQTEVDCEYLKRCCETLTEENRRLHKELQELRALKSTNPYYMQQPATTLTMCPSCERVATTTTTSATTSTPITTVANGGTATVLPNNNSDPSSKATPFPLSRPKFFPFSTTHPQKSAAS